MSCWVATSVAAELWGITVKEVLDRIHRGEVNSQTDLGFLVVDVAPHSPKLQPGGGVYIREYSRPSTYREYSRSADIPDEHTLERTLEGILEGTLTHPETPPQPESTLVPAPAGDNDPLGWQETRRLVGATRRAPRAA